ncbi:MAG: RIP metalloprotease RseP [Candidatus Amoebophilus sp.]
MQILIMIIQFVLGLSIIVGIHELGHMLFAKLFGMRVESYTIGFPPKIFRFKWGETEYGIGALPLGGSVKIAGMIDESLDTNHLSQAPQPWEFRAKPAWQRLLVMLGGIIFNTVSGLLIYICITLALGDTYLSKEEVNKHGILPNSTGMMLGFQEGDKIVNINGKDFTNFAEVISPRTLLKTNGYYTVERNGQEVRINIPSNLLEKLSEEKASIDFIVPRAPFEVKGIQPHSGAQKAGLRPGDQIVAINGQPTPYFNQLQVALLANAGQQVNITYLRDGKLQKTVAPINAAGKLGFCSRPLLRYEKRKYNLGQAIVIGSTRAIEVVRTNIIALGKIITGKVSASKSLSGPIGIAQIFGTHFDWVHFWSIVGFLSIILAFTNLLPIPALDGGHAIFLSYELITGRKVPDKVLENVQKVGLVILLLLIGYGFFNDLRKLFW